MQPRSVQPLQHSSHTENVEQQLQHGGGSAFPFTKEQYDQIMQILNSNTVSPTSTNNNSLSPTSQANAAGTSIALLVFNSPQEWIIDIGETNHIVSNVNLLDKAIVIAPPIPRKVLLPNGDVTQVTHVGDSQTSNNNTLKEELFNGRVKEIGRERDGLCFLQQHGNKRLTVVSLAAVTSKVDLSINPNDIVLWHRRPGHVSIIVLKKLFPVKLASITNAINNCCVCHCAKLTSTPFPHSSINSTSVFDPIHVDFWGPYKTATFDGYRYFLTFLAFVHTQFNKIVKMVRSDNGSEFLNSMCKTVFNKLGILHQTTCAYTLQQNGENVFPFKDSLHVSPPIFNSLPSPPTCEEVYTDICSFSHINPSTSSSSGPEPLSIAPEPCPTLRSLLIHCGTSSYDEVVQDPRWVKAMKSKIQPWEVVSLPPGKATWEVERFKARLVAKGFSQQEGIDHQKTFSLVVKIVTVRTILSVATSEHWHIHQMDVYNAFLQGDLLDEIYMTLPQGFQSQGESRPACRLLKSLYGLKQAPRQWNTKLLEALISFRFIQSQHDHSLFVQGIGSCIVVVLVYVDDMLITGPNLRLVEETKATLQKIFKVKDLGELKYFLGLEFARSSQGILMHQRKYALELVSELGLGAAKPAATPLEANVKLTTPQYDEHIGTANTLDDALLPNITSYQRLLGKLLYLTVTRPDIAFSVQTHSQFMQKPKKSHIEAALRVVKYFKNHPGQGVLLSSQKKSVISVFCDADWAACPLTWKYVSGFCIKYGDSLSHGNQISKALSLEALQGQSTEILKQQWLN
ncbi:uncharacterized protein LOC142177986 [Nicotiana tabacum]|uniref:Uncharacterized protein LOC142177986 n=1 Tax=Nicotiana tabacum TaxID=4097 RepID=A0AC58U1L1_TOBAC